MTKLWFKTKNDQIVDLNNYDSFIFTDNYPNLKKGKWLVSAHCLKYSNTIAVGEFDTKEEAQTYLDEIYSFLKSEND